MLCVCCSPTNKTSNEINIYSQRHYSVDEIQYKNFEKLTGIKVNVVKANADELIERLKNEGENTPADLFITVDAGKLFKAKELSLLQKVSTLKINENVNDEFEDKNGYWVPITYRARIVVHSNDRVDPSELSTYEDLANSKWKDRLLVRSSSNAYNQALMSSIVANLGSDSAEVWSLGLVNNFVRDPKGSDRDQVKAIAAGQGDVAIVNSYYIGLLLSSKKEEELKAGNAVSVFFPNQEEGGRGSHINVSGIGLTKYSPNKKNAIKENIKIIPHAAIPGEKFDFTTNTPNILSKKIKKNPRETPIAKFNPIPPLCLNEETETPIIDRTMQDKGSV